MQPRSTFLLFVLLLIGSTAVAEDKFRVHQLVGDPGFLVAGDWWNLYFSEKNDPLHRSIKAVKVLHVSKDHRGWVLITVPKSRDEHASIFGPAAKAHDDDSVKMREAIEKWEETVSEWKTVWVNLNYVVSASRVAINPSAEEEVEKAVKSGVGEEAEVKEMLQYMEKEGKEAYGVPAPDARSLETAVSRVNEVLQADYALLEPAPITVGRFSEAVKAKIETLAESEEEDRVQLVNALQRILAENRLPNRFLFFLAPASAKYKKQSLDEGVLDKKVVNLNYRISVAVPVGKETTQTLRLTSLKEQFSIQKLKSSEPPVANDRQTSSAEPSDQSRFASVLAEINRRLEEEFSILRPTPLTESAVRDAIASKIEAVAKSDDSDRAHYVALLQKILAAEDLPGDIGFKLLSAKDSLNNNDVLRTLLFYIEVPKKDAPLDSELLSLPHLSQKFKIARISKQIQEHK